MILNRFCSAQEYERYMAGERLANITDHSLRHSSTAKGFCFFEGNPEKEKHYLSGIVDFDYCLTFLVPDGMVERCHGKYPNWIKNGKRNGSVIKEEWCCTEYDNKDFKLLNASTRFQDYAPGPKILRQLFPDLGLW